MRQPRMDVRTELMRRSSSSPFNIRLLPHLVISAGVDEFDIEDVLDDELTEGASATVRINGRVGRMMVMAEAEQTGA